MRDWLGEDIVGAVVDLNRPVVGTGGAIKDASISNYPYLLVYGDCYSPIDIREVYRDMLLLQADMMIITRLTTEADYGLIVVDEDRVLSYRRHHEETTYRTNIGTYMIGQRAHEYIRNTGWGRTDGNYLQTMSLEAHVFSSIFNYLCVYSYDSTDIPYYDVGTPGRYKATKEVLNANTR